MVKLMICTICHANMDSNLWQDSDIPVSHKILSVWLMDKVHILDSDSWNFACCHRHTILQLDQHYLPSDCVTVNDKEHKFHIPLLTFLASLQLWGYKEFLDKVTLLHLICATLTKLHQCPTPNMKRIVKTFNWTLSTCYCMSHVIFEMDDLVLNCLK